MVMITEPEMRDVSFEHEAEALNRVSSESLKRMVMIKSCWNSGD